MFLLKLFFFILLSASISSKSFEKKKTSPPHCTQVSKDYKTCHRDTDFTSRYKLQYPAAYLIPGQREAYQQMYCLNPAEVNKAVTTVCDWSAPPQVQFTLGDEYMHVVRVDPTGRYLGNAVITTYQLCSHNRTSSTEVDKRPVSVDLYEKWLESVKDLTTV